MAADSIDGGKVLAAGTALENAAYLISQLTDDLEKDLMVLPADDRWLLDGFTNETIEDARSAIADLIEIRSRVRGGFTPEELDLLAAVDEKAAADA